jgi:hypothetical protein
MICISLGGDIIIFGGGRNSSMVQPMSSSLQEVTTVASKELNTEFCVHKSIFFTLYQTSPDSG